MKYQSRVYLHGLMQSVITSVAGVTTVVVLDPNVFNPFSGGDWRRFLAAMIIFALTGFFGYVKEHPLPDPVKDDDYQSEVRKQMVELKSTGTGDGGLK